MSVGPNCACSQYYIPFHPPGRCSHFSFLWWRINRTKCSECWQQKSIYAPKLTKQDYLYVILFDAYPRCATWRPIDPIEMYIYIYEVAPNNDTYNTYTYSFKNGICSRELKSNEVSRSRRPRKECRFNGCLMVRLSLKRITKISKLFVFFASSAILKIPILFGFACHWYFTNYIH